MHFILTLSLKLNIKKPGCVTCAVTAVSILFEHPSWITGALHRGLVLFTHLAALQVAAAIVHHLACLVAGVQVKPRGTGTHNPFPRCHGTLVAAAPSGYETHVWGKKRPGNHKNSTNTGRQGEI